MRNETVFLKFSSPFIAFQTDIIPVLQATGAMCVRSTWIFLFVSMDGLEIMCLGEEKIHLLIKSSAWFRALLRERQSGKERRPGQKARGPEWGQHTHTVPTATALLGLMSLIHPWLLISRDGTVWDNKSLHRIESCLLAGVQEIFSCVWVLSVPCLSSLTERSKTADTHSGIYKKQRGQKTHPAQRFSRWAFWIFYFTEAH